MFHEELQSAVWRCPEEIWHMILDAAIHLPPPFLLWSDLSWDNVLEPFTVQVGWNVVSPARVAELSRRRWIFNTISFLLVCRAWHGMLGSRLLRWVTVIGGRDMMTMLPVFRNPFQYQHAGCSVRRLALVQFHNDADARRMSAGNLMQLIEACPYLESLQLLYSAPHDIDIQAICSVIADGCGRTLTHLSLSGSIRVEVLALADFLVRCSRMEVISIAKSTMTESLPVPTLYPLAQPSLNIRSITLRLNACSADFLAHLNLPRLIHFNLYFDFQVNFPEGIPDPQDFPKVARMLEIHGPRLRTLEFNAEGLEHDDGFGFKLLDYCPDLETFICDLPRTDPL